MTHEKPYSIEEAQEEAAAIQEKVGPTGEKQDYDTAEHLVEEEKKEALFANISEIRLPEGQNPRLPEKVILVDKNGIEHEFSASEVIKTIGEGDEEIRVNADTAHHIFELHLSGRHPGSAFPEGYDLSKVVELISSKFDLHIIAEAQKEGIGPLKEHKYVGTIDAGASFETGVGTLEEMLENKAISPEDVAAYQAFQERIEAANRSGNEDEKKKLIDEFNAQNRPIYLGQRFPEAPITPFFDSEPIKTSEMAIVVIDHKLITTMTGHHREKLPFSPRSTFEFIKNKNPKEYARLQMEFGSDETIVEQLNKDFEVNSEDWLNAGFIQKKKPAQ